MVELRLALVFAVLSVLSLSSIALSDGPVDNKPAVYDLSYLYATREAVYFNKGSEKYTLVNNNGSHSLATGLDYHYSKGLAFFQENSSAIVSVPLESNQSPPTTVVSVEAGKVVSVFAVDWVHDRIVYAVITVTSSDPVLMLKTNHTVESANLQGGDRRILRNDDTLSETSICSMAIDPFAGKVFWILFLRHIVSCNLDGSDYKIVLTTKAVRLSNLALDLSKKRVFYTEIDIIPGTPYVNSVDYDGGHIEKDVYKWEDMHWPNHRDISSIAAFADERLVAFVSLISIKTVIQKSVDIQLIHNGHLEEDKAIYSAEKEPGKLPILEARLVHPDLQPTTEPKYVPREGGGGGGR